MTGMAVRLDVLFDPSIILTALGITVIAIFGKLIAGWAATGRVNKMIVGWSMVPRGEVGLIFATIGKSLGVVSDQVFSIIVIMVILTTLLAPPALTYLLKREAALQPNAVVDASAVAALPHPFWQWLETHGVPTSTRHVKKLRIRGIHWKIPTKH